MNSDDVIRQYFLTQENEVEWLSWMDRALAQSLEILRPRAGGKICSDVSLLELERIFSETALPSEGFPLEAVFREACEKVLAHSVRVADPRFVGHMTGALPFFGLLTDILVSALNQNVVKIETALSASFVEKQTLAWLHRMIYGKSEQFYKNAMHRSDVALGNITNGGTLGNLTALTVARNLMLPNAASDGLAAAMMDRGMRRVVILASKRVHYSIKKAATVLGVGARNVIEIPVEPGTNKIALAALEATLDQLEKHKTGVMAIVGIAGATETGSIDDLQTLARLAHDRGIWFHVDAAWGGAFVLSEKHRSLVAGIEEADSVVLDGHKLFYLTMNHGAVLFRNERALDSIRHSANYIIRPGSVDLGRTSLEGSRRFDSFKLWFFLKVMGRGGYEALINQSCEMAQSFASAVQTHAAFELTSAPETNILTYRFVPSCWRNSILAMRSGPLGTSQEVASLRFANDFLNDVNIEIQKRQRLAGRSFVSRTTLESVYPGIDVVVLRAVLMNPFTTPAIVQEILADQLAIGNDVVAEKWPQVAVHAPTQFTSIFGTLPDLPS
jgi:glutamate decarboxylase